MQLSLSHSGRFGVLAVALAMAVAPIAARAQDIPSYAQPAYVSADETIHGRIRSVDGAFTISVSDDRGFVDNIALHQGTIINPTGLSLSPGMSVTILGVNDGSTFSANEIDTPYTYSGPLPDPVYYGAGYWAPGFAYGYGPAFSLAIIIGGGGYGRWSYEHRPFYGRPWNGHGYFGADIARTPIAGGRVETRREFNNPALRAETSVRTNRYSAQAHAPAAFVGRSFAGESRVAPDRFETESTARTSGGYERAQSAQRSSGYQRSGGYERSEGFAHSGGPVQGSAHAGTPAGGHGAGASHGGGGGHPGGRAH